jgi:hypothetical protein
VAEAGLYKLLTNVLMGTQRVLSRGLEDYHPVLGFPRHSPPQLGT